MCITLARGIACAICALTYAVHVSVASAIACAIRVLWLRHLACAIRDQPKNCRQENIRNR